MTHSETTYAQDDAREEMYRVLTAGEQDDPQGTEEPADGGMVYTITREEGPLGLASFMPEYRYRFDGETPGSGDAFLDELARFLAANEYLARQENPTREFARGFACAAAITALYMDSLELEASGPRGKDGNIG